MKSAYELAMERLKAADPEGSRPLSPEQKSRLAEIDRIYQGRIAEREIFLNQQLESLRAAGNQEEAAKVKKQLTGERARLEEEREEEKDKIRKSVPGAA